MIDLSVLELLVVLASPFVGSFLGVLIDRLPADEPVVFGRSRCDACGRTLGPVDLVPLVSWVLLRARCRHCGARLSAIHPVIEICAVLIAIWSVLVVPEWLVLPTAFLGWVLLTLAVIDLRHMLLPDVLTLPLVAAGLAIAATLGADAFLDNLIGALVGGGLFVAVTLVYRRATMRDGLGLGDAKLFAGAGAWVGWQGLASVLLIGAASGLVVTMILLSARGVRGTSALRTEVPFGPYLAFASWLTWLYGPLQLA